MQEKPFKRTVRQFSDGKYSEGGRWMYIRHPEFCRDSEHYVRAFQVLQKDYLNILDYIEPDDVNWNAYSFRIHELLMRVCIEIEANFKAILRDNNYELRKNLSMKDYKKIEKSHYLSMYEVKFPVWRGGEKILRPFENWSQSGSPGWYQAYNKSKHDRHNHFHSANFGNLSYAIAGIVSVLGAQFLDGCFSSRASIVASFDNQDKFDDAIGGYFKIKFPENIPLSDRYDFVWRDLEKQQNPFACFPYE